MNKMLYVLVPAALMVTPSQAANPEGLAQIIALSPLTEQEEQPVEPKANSRLPVESVAVVPELLIFREEDRYLGDSPIPGTVGNSGPDTVYRSTGYHRRMMG